MIYFGEKSRTSSLCVRVFLCYSNVFSFIRSVFVVADDTTTTTSFIFIYLVIYLYLT